MTRTYTASATRGGRYWVIQIKDGNHVTVGYTQARWRWQVKNMALDWLITKYDELNAENVTVKVVKGVE